MDAQPGCGVTASQSEGVKGVAGTDEVSKEIEMSEDGVESAGVVGEGDAASGDTSMNSSDLNEAVDNTYRDDASDSSRSSSDKKSKETVEEQVERAVASKMRGNAMLKDHKFRMAANHYKKGLRMMKDYDNDQDGVAEARKALNLNLALALIKLSDFLHAAKAADEVVKIDPSNIKALFRRGVANSGCGNLDQARRDLTAVCRAEPANSEARSELEKVKVKAVEAKEKEKMTFGSLFSKKVGDVSLYGDKEEEMKRRSEEEAKIMGEKRARYEQHKRKMIDEDDAPPTDIPTFDEWNESEKAKDDALKEENKNKHEEEERQRRDKEAEQKRQKAASEVKSGDGGDEPAAPAHDDDDLSAEDKKIIEETKKKGYCYFKRELSAAEKAQAAAYVPQRISTDSSATDPSHSAPPPQPIPATDGGKALSSWNTGGTTYEEKDMSAWCKTNLESHLLKAHVVK
eukprot:GHVN01093964.1.p1 GENE.GHVN01093964.1~~GHVN01093964.1.p1  ORF type:complete len:458 (+),score=150.52 GHVN01093964.1:225-1598(+)